NEYAPPCSKGPGQKVYTFHLYALSKFLDIDSSASVSAPVSAKQPYAKVIWPYTDLNPLNRGRRVKITLEVALYCDDIMCATFTGQFVSLPPKNGSVD
ncbi:YiiD C-terminal domain-containing protein, partial [Shewanella sp. SG41-4]|uniref:YiiD C-terminal domain-containing protein n=1 Tax=Shewanella sp. SG41-4 TaxID=2760976 RepID=UPI002175D6BB